ncbi:MAG TPA: serine hydrolase [Gemmatimonadaceae bacterium]|nr:serine hydrolase [Gemmatimonadaceae bacterium]
MRLISAAFVVTAVTAPQTPDSLEHALRARIAEVPGARVAVAYRHLGRADSLFLNADTSYHAASTMKVPVMIALFQRIDRGELTKEDEAPLINEFRSIVDGSSYSLSPDDDSDSALYARVGTHVPVGELIERMIVRSSNLATNAVIDLAGGGPRITAAMRTLGAQDIEVRRGVEDGKAYRAGLNNTTTARDLATILAALERGEAATPASTAAMRDILLRQEFNDGIPAGLPPGTRVAHKTGWITATAHDAAIVYPKHGAPYVLVVLTGGIPEHAVAKRLTADIARIVDEWVRSGGARN